MTFLQRIFSIPRGSSERPGTVSAAAQGSQQAVNVFLSPESLATFPGASLGVGVLFAIAKIFFPESDPRLLVVVIALVVGGAIFLVGINTPGSRPVGTGWVLAVLVAVINAFMLATTVLGLPVLTGPAPVSTPSVSPTPVPPATPG